MTKSKKKQESSLSTGSVIAIVIGVVIIVAIIASTASNNSYEDISNGYDIDINDYVDNSQEYYCDIGYTLCGDSCYSCEEGYYLATDCNCYPTEDTLYEKTDGKWTEYVEVLSKDLEKTEDVLDNYCYGVQYSEFPNCYNFLQPRLEAYATHIVNAQNFLSSTGDTFSNRNSLSASLDEEAVYVTSISNWLGSEVTNYNNWVATQQYEQEISRQNEQAIYDTISILSMFI